MANQIGGILNGNPGPYAIPQRSLRRPIDRCVMRSTAALHEEQKPSRANAAQSSHVATSSAPAVSTIVAQPRSFMIARVLPPLAERRAIERSADILANQREKFERAI
jgi:hypothetical protein